jgi:hypothetical protein
MGDEIRPFEIHVSEADLEDLKKAPTRHPLARAADRP